MCIKACITSARSCAARHLWRFGSARPQQQHAIDQDLEVTVLSDLCVDADKARHDACMDAVLPTLARVMPSDEWLATLGSGPDGSPQKTAAGALRGLL